MACIKLVKVIVTEDEVRGLRGVSKSLVKSKNECRFKNKNKGPVSLVVYSKVLMKT